MASKGILLDTHIFIWAMEGSNKLTPTLKNRITNPLNKIFVSVASILEIVLKRKRGKIKLSFDIESSIKTAGFEIINIELTHVLAQEKLPLYHKDPFDRILIAQSIVENLSLVSKDSKIGRYKLID